MAKQTKTASSKDEGIGKAKTKDESPAFARALAKIKKLEDENQELRKRVKEAVNHIKAVQKDIDEYDKLLTTIERNLYTEAERVSVWPDKPRP